MPVRSLAVLGISAVLAALTSLFALPVAPVEPAEAEEDRQQEAEETRRAMELFLREQRVLFRKGELALELDSFYSTDTREQFLRTETPGTFAKVTTRTATMILIPRYGLLDGLELDLLIPFGFAEQEVDLGVARRRREDLGLGDIAGSLRYQLLYEGRVRPDLTLELEVKSRTGGDTLLGTAHWHVGGGVALVKTLDPVVFFGHLRYSATLERQGRDPGDILSYVFGMGYSLNERVSFNMRLGGALVGRTAVGGQEIPGSSLEILSLQFGVTTRVARDVFVEPIVSVGITEEAPDAVAGVSLVYQFRRRR